MPDHWTNMEKPKDDNLSYLERVESTQGEEDCESKNVYVRLHKETDNDDDMKKVRLTQIYWEL